MRFVILSDKVIPGYNVKGPILSPAEYDVHLVLRWISLGIDVREYMENGAHRKLKSNDPKLIELLNEKIERETKKREEWKKRRIDNPGMIDSRANAKLKPERLPQRKQKPVPKKVVEPKVVEPPKEEVIEDVVGVDENIEIFIDELERPE